MYELAFSSQQPKAKKFRKYCCNVLFPRIRKHLSNEIEIKHQQAIEEKDAALALLNDDLHERDTQIEAIRYENVGLQGEITAHRHHVADLIENRHVPRRGKHDNVLVVIEKNQPDEEGRLGSTSVLYDQVPKI